MPTLECPTCQRIISYSDSKEIPFRPFCSKRCKLVDLGRWLNEEYRVTEETPPDIADGAASPPNPADGD